MTKQRGADVPTPPVPEFWIIAAPERLRLRNPEARGFLIFPPRTQGAALGYN